MRCEYECKDDGNKLTGEQTDKYHWGDKVFLLPTDVEETKMQKIKLEQKIKLGRKIKLRRSIKLNTGNKA